jgi:hypothetical protein
VSLSSMPINSCLCEQKLPKLEGRRTPQMASNPTGKIRPIGRIADIIRYRSNLSLEIESRVYTPESTARLDKTKIVTRVRYQCSMDSDTYYCRKIPTSIVIDKYSIPGPRLSIANQSFHFLAVRSTCPESAASNQQLPPYSPPICDGLRKICRRGTGGQTLLDSAAVGRRCSTGTALLAPESRPRHVERLDLTATVIYPGLNDHGRAWRGHECSCHCRVVC